VSDVPGPTGGIVPPYITERIRILRRSCPVCGAQSMMPCTVPTDTGRREVRWFHLDREFGPELEEQEDC
jgi:hypothetical protein